MSKRPETGPMCFGDDWPGAFIRSDEAFGYADALDEILDTVAGHARPRRSDLEALRDVLRSGVCVDGADPEGTQRALLMQPSSSETKEIDSCLSCPMFNRDLDMCTHWGSPFGNKIDPFKHAPPDWCPIRKKPLLLRVVR